jgi:flavin-dependent dehydrogenase
MRSALIIGGGPAGATAATILARAGHPVTVIERSAGPTDKVCGDFLSAEAIEALTALGLDLPALGASPVRRLRLAHAGRSAETPLPFPAVGLTRRTLDEALLRLAADAGALIVRGQAVRSVTPNGSGFHVRSDKLADWQAGTVFLATGKHDLRELPRAGRADGSVGLKMYFQLAPEQDAALGDAIELMLFPGGYAGLQHVEAGRAVLCLTILGQRLRAAGTQWSALLPRLQADCPRLAARLAGARSLLAKPLAIAGIPYGLLYRPERGAPEGLFRLGDQACVIPSLTGDGVSIALHSARLAADTFLHHGNAAARYHWQLRRDLRAQMWLASALQQVCTRPSVQAGLVAACGVWPGVPRLAARWTRLGRACPHRHQLDRTAHRQNLLTH